MPPSTMIATKGTASHSQCGLSSGPRIGAVQSPGVASPGRWRRCRRHASAAAAATVIAAGKRNTSRDRSHPQSPTASASVEMAFSPTPIEKTAVSARESSIGAEPDQEEPTQGRGPRHNPAGYRHERQTIQKRELGRAAAPGIHQVLGQHQVAEDLDAAEDVVLRRPMA